MQHPRKPKHAEHVISVRVTHATYLRARAYIAHANPTAPGHITLSSLCATALNAYLRTLEMTDKTYAAQVRRLIRHLTK